MTLSNPRFDLKKRSPEEIEQILADAWLNIYVDESKIANPLDNIPPEMHEEPHLYISWLMTQPEYFSFLCSEILNINLLPFQCVILQELWRRKFPMLIATRGGGKSWILALYALLRVLLMPNRKVVICGAAFRQSKVIYEYITGIWNNAPILRDIVGTSGSNGPRFMTDMCRFTCNQGNTITALPLGNGEKIRGQRANDILSDEFASIPIDIFETVIAGFGVVSSSPMENVQDMASTNLAKRFNLWEEPEESNLVTENQIVLSGTAYYDFNHFAAYWKRWKTIINSQGDPKKLAEIFDDGVIPEDFDWKDYSVIRIPYKLIPKGFMDDGMIARAKATVHTGIFQMEYEAVFSTDSNGFYRRTLIETCVASPSNDEVPFFIAAVNGNSNFRYIYGIDTASEVDNFAIVILELHDNHRRVVHTWTTNRADHKERVKKNLEKETDFYSFCCRKIRDLMRRFPAEILSIDSQGGGIAIIEGLHDKDKMREDEHPIWEVIDPDKAQDTDGHAGLHIIEKVNFASADWTGEANHGMRKDFEDKVCIFPYFDSGAIAIAMAQDELGNRHYDTLEDCVMDIEELKNELSTITITQTTTGRDRWDTPEVKLPGGKKGSMRKDRYSSLLMANMSARQLSRRPDVAIYDPDGGWAHRGSMADQKDAGFVKGPSWFTESIKGIYD